MKFGIFSNGMRGNVDPSATYAEDLEEIMAADQLGYDQAWVSEHMGFWLPDAVAHADLLVAHAASRTEKIALGPAVRILPLFHPIDIAISAAMCDQMSKGRYMLGVGPGIVAIPNMERRGLRNDDRHAMMVESLQFLLKIWESDTPFDWEGRFWQGRNIQVFPKPYQKKLSVAIATGQEEVVGLAVEHDWTIMTGLIEDIHTTRARLNQFDAMRQSAGKPRDRAHVTVSRFVHVAETEALARAAIREDVEFMLNQWKARTPARFNGYVLPGEDLESLHFDDFVDRGMISCGTPDQVFDKLSAFHEDLGGFGALMIGMGKNWGRLEDRVNSLRLFKSEVAPKLLRL